jgi:hypothetical protein
MDIFTRIGDGMGKGDILIMLEKLGIVWNAGQRATQFIPEAPFLVLCNSGKLGQSSGSGSQVPVNNQTFLMLAEQRVRSRPGSISFTPPMAFDESLAQMYKKHYVDLPTLQGKLRMSKPLNRVSSKVSRRRDVLRRLSIE